MWVPNGSAVSTLTVTNKLAEEFAQEGIAVFHFAANRFCSRWPRKVFCLVIFGRKHNNS